MCYKNKWNPCNNMEYYYVGVSGQDGINYTATVYKAIFHSGSFNAIFRLAYGNCYETREEAEKHCSEWLKKLTPTIQFQE